MISSRNLSGFALRFQHDTHFLNRNSIKCPFHTSNSKIIYIFIAINFTTSHKKNWWKIFHLNEWQMVVWVSLILYSFSLLNSIEAHAYIFHSQRHNTGYPQCEIEVGCNAWRHICLRDAEHINISDVNFKYWASNWSIQLSFNWNAMQLRFHLVKSSWWYPNFPLLFSQFFYAHRFCDWSIIQKNKNKMSCRWTFFFQCYKKDRTNQARNK